MFGLAKSNNKLTIKGEPMVATAASSGADLCALKDTIIPPYGTVVIPTGVSINVEGEYALDYDIQVRPRSSTLQRWGLMVIPGTVDEDYTGDIGILVYNIRNSELRIGKGLKLAQLVIGKRVKEWPNGVKVSGNVREGGFGSTN
jgi:dUTP pyrophosphatase